MSTEEEEVVAKAASSLQNIPVMWFRKVKCKSKQNHKNSSSPSVTSQQLEQQDEQQQASTHREQIGTKEDCPTNADDDERTTSSFTSHLEQQLRAFFLEPPTKSSSPTINQTPPPTRTRTSLEMTNHSSNSNHISNSSIVAGVLSFVQQDDHPDTGNGQEEEQEEETSTYAKFDAVLNVCDTDSGPAIELRTTSKKFSKHLDNFELVDFDEKLDTMVNLSGDGSSSGSRTNECFLERIIPLDMIGHAARGGKWELENMLQVGSGDFSCGIKVYSRANEYQLIGNGKKVLLFDLSPFSPVDRDEAIRYINALVKWNTSRLAYISTVNDDSDAFSLQKFCC